MPPVQAYSVNFANGNLHPHVNLFGWPDMIQTSRNEPFADSIFDGAGIQLRYRRWAQNPPGAPTANGIYLRLPAADLSLDSRLFAKATFDDPWENEFSADQNWAIVLSIGISSAADGAPSDPVLVTCQFNHQLANGVPTPMNGLRLNTPYDSATQLGALQSDKAAPIDAPVDFSRYSSPDQEPTLFILEHAFCGWGLGTNHHTPGSGALTLREPSGEERGDRRIFSSNALKNVGLSPAGISSMWSFGIALTTVGGVGLIHARMRTFELWLNQSIGGPAPSPTRPGQPIVTPR